MTRAQLEPTRTALRFTRRQALARPGSTAKTGLLVACDPAHADAPPARGELMPQAVSAVVKASAPAAPRVAALMPFGQATQTSFLPIDSGLTFGPPTDVAAGWDGTLWAID